LMSLSLRTHFYRIRVFPLGQSFELHRNEAFFHSPWYSTISAKLHFLKDIYLVPPFQLFVPFIMTQYAGKFIPCAKVDVEQRYFTWPWVKSNSTAWRSSGGKPLWWYPKPLWINIRSFSLRILLTSALLTRRDKDVAFLGEIFEASKLASDSVLFFELQKMMHCLSSLLYLRIISGTFSSRCRSKRNVFELDGNETTWISKGTGRNPSSK
jgi:hypothetical protein